jgi:hypothetical protein
MKRWALIDTCVPSRIFGTDCAGALEGASSRPGMSAAGARASRERRVRREFVMVVPAGWMRDRSVTK